MDDLPNTFDLIVVGTGMSECILAAAAARIGKSVLHIDRNGHYGGNWASFNFDQLLNYFDEQLTLPEVPSERMLEALWLEQLNDNERLMLCPKPGATLFHIVQKSYIKDRKPTPQNETIPPTPNETTPDETLSSLATETLENLEQIDETAITHTNTVEGSSEASSANISHIDSDDVNNAMEVAAASGDPIAQISEPTNVPKDKSSQEWTMEDLKENRRKFNLDLSPKLLFSRGPMVELLISSNIARYAEFQCVNRVLTFINGHLEQVPCSRADVFSTKNVSVVEKRMLMKLLTFCIEYQKHPEEYRGFEGKPFLEFLRSRKVTPNIEHYVLHAIAMVDETCPTLQGLSATQKFMESLGRYGNSPFLWSCFGSGELPQCFCRLCAVFGGTYHLKRDADAVILNSERESVGIITGGKKISCQSLIMEYSYAPKQYVPETSALVSRAIYITDASILPSQRQQNTLLKLPPVEGVQNVITILEFGSLSFISPDNLYVVHMICQSLHDSVEEDFKSAETQLFKSTLSEQNSDEIIKPRVLWCTYFHQIDNTSVIMNDKVPKQLFITSAPGPHLDYDHAVNEAKEIFQKLYPEEEFLPRAPDPDEIVMDECSNPGENVGLNENEICDIESDSNVQDSDKIDVNSDSDKINDSSSITNTEAIEPTSLIEQHELN